MHIRGRVRACAVSSFVCLFVCLFFSLSGVGGVLPSPHQPSPAARNACGAEDVEQEVWEHAQAFSLAQRKSRAREMVAKERQEVSEPAAVSLGN